MDMFGDILGRLCFFTLSVMAVIAIGVFWFGGAWLVYMVVTGHWH